MLIFETVLIQSFTCFGCARACLFSKHAYFQKGAYNRASTVYDYLLYTYRYIYDYIAFKINTKTVVLMLRYT